MAQATALLADIEGLVRATRGSHCQWTVRMSVDAFLPPLEPQPVDRSGPRLIHDPSDDRTAGDRKSTRLNSSHGYISYAVFCLKKKHTPSHLEAARRECHLEHLPLDAFKLDDLGLSTGVRQPHHHPSALLSTTRHTHPLRASDR